VLGYAVALGSNAPVTGETGTPYYSVAGVATGSTGALVEKDSVNMPGSYYVELPAAAVAEANNGKPIEVNFSSGTATFVFEVIEVGWVWDQKLTGATSNIATSAGRRLRTLPGVAHEGTAQGPGPNGNHIILESTASSTSGAYDPALVTITGGTGEGQTRLILEYDGPSRTATVDRTWRVNPDATSQYSVLPVAGRNSVNEGRLQGATSTTATLNADASGIDNAYLGQILFLRSGIGEDQVRYIIAYDGTTKVATVDHAWDTTPDGDTGYMMMANVATAQQPAGLNTVTLTIHDQNSNPVPGVVVDIYDSSDTIVVGRVIDEDLNGIVTLALNDGSYNVRAVTTGFQLDTIPQPLTVSGTTAETFVGTLFVAPASVNPTQCTVYGTLYKTEGGDEWNGQCLSFYATADGVVDANVQGNLLAQIVTGPTDANPTWLPGAFQIELPRLATVLCVSTALGTPGSLFSVSKVIPDQASATFDSIFRP
jgi:hypothetical protein